MGECRSFSKGNMYVAIAYASCYNSLPKDWWDNTLHLLSHSSCLLSKFQFNGCNQSAWCAFVMQLFWPEIFWSKFFFRWLLFHKRTSWFCLLPSLICERSTIWDYGVVGIVTLLQSSLLQKNYGFTRKFLIIGVSFSPSLHHCIWAEG